MPASSNFTASAFVARTTPATSRFGARFVPRSATGSATSPILRIDGLHHRIALYPSKRNGLLYAAFEVEALDQIMQNSYFMQESQIRIVQGPGREAASRQMFLHVEGPDGLIFSYVNGMAEIDGKPRLARQFPLNAASLCDWGSESKDVPELRAPGR